MKRKLTVMLILLLVITLILAGCVNPFLPVYERIDVNGIEDEDGIKVVINEVEYKMFPELKWTVHTGGETIGYAGSRKTVVSRANGDTKMNFIFLKDSGWGNYYSPLYRTDVEIPEPNSESVDKISYREQDFQNDNSNIYSNTISDKEVIKEFFDILERDDKIKDVSKIKNFSISISCFSEKVPGATYYLLIVRSGDKLMCGEYDEGFVEITSEMLEKIAGKKIDISELLAN